MDRNKDRAYLNSTENYYNNQYFQEQIKAKNKEKSNEFRKRFDAFENIETIDEAKEFLNKTMPVAGIKTAFTVGDAKVVILNTYDKLRITFSTQEEYISYNFV